MHQITELFATTANAAAPAGVAAPEENIFVSLVPFALIFVVFYFLIIRPQQKKFKQHQALISAIKMGDRVVLSSGIIGKVSKTENAEGVIEVEIASNVTVKVVAATISSVTQKDKSSNDNKKAA